MGKPFTAEQQAASWKKKRLSKSKMFEECATVLQKLVRLLAADSFGFCKCVSCNKRSKWNEGMEGGHFIGRVVLSTKIVKRNIHPQCTYCNNYNKEHSKVPYEQAIGERLATRLRQLSNRTLEWPEPIARERLAKRIVLWRKYIKRELERIKPHSHPPTC